MTETEHFCCTDDQCGLQEKLESLGGKRYSQTIVVSNL